MPMLTDKINTGKINIALIQASKVMLAFNEGVLTARKSDTIITYRKRAIAIAEREIKNFKKLAIMWKEENNQLKRSFEFKDFVEAFTFMTEVAFAAEKISHHPNWSNVYNKVDIVLFTHDAKDSITEKDLKLSKEIDRIYKKE